MSWAIVLAQPARKTLARVPEPDQKRLARALLDMRDDPFRGDLRKLTVTPPRWRRRVGDWRLFFKVDRSERVVTVAAIERRTSTTC